jgi:hypothetical protein
MRIRVLLGAGACALASLTVQTPANAAGTVVAVTACPITDTTWTFSPSLVSRYQEGTITIFQHYACASAGLSTNPISVPNQVITDQANGITFDYAGTCTSAVFGDANWSGLLLAGSVAVVQANGALGAGTEAYVVVPNSICDESFATGVGAFAGIQ